MRRETLGLGFGFGVLHLKQFGFLANTTARHRGQFQSPGPRGLASQAASHTGMRCGAAQSTFEGCFHLAGTPVQQCRRRRLQDSACCISSSRQHELFRAGVDWASGAHHQGHSSLRQYRASRCHRPRSGGGQGRDSAQRGRGRACVRLGESVHGLRPGQHCAAPAPRFAGASQSHRMARAVSDALLHRLDRKRPVESATCLSPT